MTKWRISFCLDLPWFLRFWISVEFAYKLSLTISSAAFLPCESYLLFRKKTREPKTGRVYAHGTGGAAAIMKAVELWIYFAIRLIDLPSLCISLSLFGCQSGQSYFRCVNSPEVLRSYRLALCDRIRNSAAVSVSLHSAPVFTYRVESFKASSLFKTHSSHSSFKTAYCMYPYI